MTVTEDSVAASELENVIAVFGAVDLAVQDDPTGERRARVAALLPHYESPQVHWYRVMLQLAIDRGANLPMSIGDSDESVAEALRALTETMPGSNHLAARRLLGLYAAAQAVPEIFAPEGSHGPLVAGALSAVLRQLESGETSGRADAAAEHLHEFMAAEHPSSDEQSSEERWDEMIEEVRQYVDVSGLDRPSCTDRPVERPGYAGPAAALRSEFDVTGVPFIKACKILAPENWPRCMNIWCHMDPRDAPPHRYDEEVSTNCRSPANAFFTKHAVLDFHFDDSDEEFAITTYNLAPVEQPPDGLVVDRGSLVVHQLPDRLHVTTTKRLRFKGALSGVGLSFFACLFGWTGKGKEMFYKCAQLRDDQLRRVLRLEDEPSRPSVPSRGKAGSQRGTTREGAVSARIAQQTAATIKDCVDDQAAFMQDWADRVADEDYGYGEMADDMAKAAVRMVRDSARIMDLAVRNARLGAEGARAQRERPAAQPAPPAEPRDQEERPSWTTTPQ